VEVLAAKLVVEAGEGLETVLMHIPPMEQAEAAVVVVRQVQIV
jgi:hypothetical protein